MFNEDYLSQSRPPMRSLNTLNVCQINHLNFSHKLKNNQNPIIFSDSIGKSIHKYPTIFSKSVIA